MTKQDIISRIRLLQTELGWVEVSVAELNSRIAALKAYANETGKEIEALFAEAEKQMEHDCTNCAYEGYSAACGFCTALDAKTDKCDACPCYRCTVSGIEQWRWRGTL